MKFLEYVRHFLTFASSVKRDGKDYEVGFISDFLRGNRPNAHKYGCSAIIIVGASDEQIWAQMIDLWKTRINWPQGTLHSQCNGVVYMGCMSPDILAVVGKIPFEYLRLESTNSSMRFSQRTDSMVTFGKPDIDTQMKDKYIQNLIRSLKDKRLTPEDRNKIRKELQSLKQDT